MKYVYSFNETNANMYELFGTKGVNLTEITNLGLSVPEGFIITTEACNQYYKDNEKINSEIQKQIIEYIIKLENITGKKIGDKNNPLLFSIRCGPKTTIPNIINPILNIGLNEKIVESLSKNTDEFIWIWECYLNFIQSYSKFVMGIDLESFERIENILKNNNSQLTINDLKIFVNELKKEYKLKTQIDFPNDSKEQLMSIINACFKSWNNKQANIYRKDLDIPFDSGMSIYIQSMVFGNINKNCGVGTIYTRDPWSGEKNLICYFSKKSQKNHVNINIESPLENSELSREFPQIYNELKKICKLLEDYYENMQKIEFVIENNKLFIIQTSKGKRTAQAALKIACDFIDERTKKLEVISMNNSTELNSLSKDDDLIEKKDGPVLKKIK